MKKYCKDKHCTYRMCKKHFINAKKNDIYMLIDERNFHLCKKVNGDKYRKKINTSYEYERKAKPVFCVELNKVFPSAVVAEEVVRVNREYIRRCCRGTFKKAGGYTWKYIEVEN